MKNKIQILRENLKLTQMEMANKLNIPVKSIRNWEQTIRTPSNYIVELMIDVLLRKANEQILMETFEYIPSFLTIKDQIKKVASTHNIEKVFLYGSYAKGMATLQSDIDLFIVSDIEGLDYFGLIEDLRNGLHKKIDLLSNKTIQKDSLIDQEIKQTGILIYQR